MTLSLSLLPALTPVLASNFTLCLTWCKLCPCKLSQLIPHVISSSSPTTCNFCPTHLLQVLVWPVAQRRHLALQEFLSQALFLQHGVLSGCSNWQMVLPSTTARNRLLCGPGHRRKVEMRYATVPRTPCFCLLLNYIAQSRKDPLKGIKKQEVIANSNPCRCL